MGGAGTVSKWAWEPNLGDGWIEVGSTGVDGTGVGGGRGCVSRVHEEGVEGHPGGGGAVERAREGVNCRGKQGVMGASREGKLRR